MKEYYTGRAIDMKQAVAAANNIAIARLISTGEASPGSPGQAYYDNARIEIKETLRGEPFEQASISYTCQTIPESIAEKAPIKDSIYIFFLGIGKSHIRAIKIMPATDDYLQELKKLLEMK